MKILILGAGGVGGYFGARLLQSGADVTFLVREARQKHLFEHGLRVETPREEFSLQPRMVTSESLLPGYDLVVITSKSYDLNGAIKALDRIGDSAFILPLLNGIEHFDLLDDKYGSYRVLGGVAYIAVALTAEGTVRQLTNMHSLAVGARHPAQEVIIDEFVGICHLAEFDVLKAKNIIQVLWDKWTFLSTLAGMTTLCRGSVGEIVATPHGDSLIREMYAECCAVASASGYACSQETQERDLALLTAQGSALTASMLRDLVSGQRTEHEQIIGAMALRGVTLGIPMRLLLMAHTHLLVEAGSR